MNRKINNAGSTLICFASDSLQTLSGFIKTELVSANAVRLGQSDGNKIAFSRDGANFTDIFVTNADGSKPVKRNIRLKGKHQLEIIFRNFCWSLNHLEHSITDIVQN